jgi:hypothetical protein
VGLACNLREENQNSTPQALLPTLLLSTQAQVDQIAVLCLSLALSKRRARLQADSLQNTPTSVFSLRQAVAMTTAADPAFRKQQLEPRKAACGPATAAYDATVHPGRLQIATRPHPPPPRVMDCMDNSRSLSPHPQQ